MRILLIGNYLPRRQYSMQFFSAMLKHGLEEAGHEVRLVQPAAVWGRLKPSAHGIDKWLGYWDCFVPFRSRLRSEVEWAEVVHICDHTNAVYIPWLNGKPHVVTCHDLLAIQSALGEISENRTRWTGRVYQRWILGNLRRAQQVICVSQHTQHEWLRLGGKKRNSHVVYNSLHYPYQPMHGHEVQTRLPQLNIGTKPYIVHIGSDVWYKNRIGLLRLFAALIQHPIFNGFQLVIAGNLLPPDLREWVHRHNLADRVTETGHVNNEELRALYCGAQMLLFPSLQEGFGWPIIEAQACGCPVVTTNRPPMTEIGGQGALYIDPSRPQEAAITVVDGWSKRDILIQAGFANMHRYSNPAMLEGYLSVYAMVIELHGKSVAIPPQHTNAVNGE